MEDMVTNPLEIAVTDQQSLVHVGSLDSFDITEGGRQAAKLVLGYLNHGGKKKLTKAIEIYELIIPNENFGGEYTALEWVCKYLLAPEEAKEDMLSVPLIRGFWEEISANNFDNLKTYMLYKYHIKEYEKGVDNTQLKARIRYLEDFILFNNPDRERWESTRENLQRVGLKPGMKVADVGCGPGYYTFKFADIVGETGRVYASETNPRHLEFLRRFVKDHSIDNVEIVESSFNGIGLPPEIRVDAVYICSLYHNVYAAFTDAERDEFVESIRVALGENGHKLIIVDNDLVTQENLPYHGPYINKKMIASQLWFYGFELESTFQFTPQRYVMVFNMTDKPTYTPVPHEPSTEKIYIDSPGSKIRYRIIGTSTSGYTCRGKIPGRIMYEGLKENDVNKLEAAYKGFEELWPKERIGDDYTAFMWLIRYRLADSKGRAEMSADKLTQMWSDFWCGNDFENIKTYLYYKFDLALPDDPNASIDVNYEYKGKDFPIPRLNNWNEYLIFNNPNRVVWEHTDDMLKLCDIRPGEIIADIGCGGGYFTWQFSKMVGDNGMVYATEINDGALSYLRDFVDKYNVKNIKPIVTRMNDAGLEENSVDTIYMCSMYHAVYITDIEYVKDSFIATIHKALRKGGRLIIVDNAVTERDVPPYYGPGISPELIITQLTHYGFRLKARWQDVPQRFALIFEEVEDYVPPVVVSPEPDKNTVRRKKGGKMSEAERLQQILRPKDLGKFAFWRKKRPEGPEGDNRSRD